MELPKLDEKLFSSLLGVSAGHHPGSAVIGKRCYQVAFRVVPRQCKTDEF